MADLKALSRRKRLTGREAGILEFEHACENQRASVEGGKAEPVIKDMRAFWEKLSRLTEEERAEYNRYLQFHEWILRNHNQAAYNDAMARLNLKELSDLIEWREAAEETLQFIFGADLTQAQINAMPKINRVARGMDDLIDLETRGLNEAGRKEANNVACIVETIEIRTYYLRGYNYVLDRAAELLDVPGVKYFKVDMKPINDLTCVYNAQTEELKLIASGSPLPPDHIDFDGPDKKRAAAAIYKPVKEKNIGELSENERAEMDILIETLEGFYSDNDIESYYIKPLKKKFID